MTINNKIHLSNNVLVNIIWASGPYC